MFEYLCANNHTNYVCVLQVHSPLSTPAPAPLAQVAAPTPVGTAAGLVEFKRRKREAEEQAALQVDPDYQEYLKSLQGNHLPYFNLFCVLCFASLLYTCYTPVYITGASLSCSCLCRCPV